MTPTDIPVFGRETPQSFQYEKKPEMREQGSYIFALDIGTRTVVGILGEYIDEKFYVRDCVVVPHTKRAMVDGQIEDIKQVAKIVSVAKSQLEERNSIKLKNVSIAAAGRALRTVQTDMDFDVSDKDVLTNEHIRSMEIETIQKAQQQLDEQSPNKNTTFYCVGHSIIKYLLDDYKIITLEGHKGSTANVEIIAAFLPSVVVEGLYAVMDMNGLEVTSLTLEPIAAMNVIIPPEIRLINIALVDIGAGTSDIAISKDGSIVAYAMATTAGDEITDELIKAFFVDFDTAEKLKRACSADEDVEYRDIFGITRTVSPAEIVSKIQPAIENLAETICSSIVQVNGAAPAAVFLIGGGALTKGLTTIVSNKLSIDEQRVAIGGHDLLKNIDTCGKKMGAEFVTPIGIGVTAVLNQGYDFSVITLNDEKVRVFDTKQLSVFELLNVAGYKTTEIMGRSGRSLTYTLNGKNVTLRGGGLTPASIHVNGKPASLTTKITQGDSVIITPAVCGENAHITLGEAINCEKYNTGYISFGGEKHKIGVSAKVNGKEMPMDYDIEALDSIESGGILTLGDLIQSLGIELSGIDYYANGVPADESYVLKDGDLISCSEELASAPEPMPIDEPAAEEETAEEPAEEEIPEEEPIKAAPSIPDTYEEELWKEIHVILNDRKITLPEKKEHTPHTFLELLNYIELDPKNPQGDILILLNGRAANYNDTLRSGDYAVIRWQPRVTR